MRRTPPRPDAPPARPDARNTPEWTGHPVVTRCLVHYGVFGGVVPTPTSGEQSVGAQRAARSRQPRCTTGTLGSSSSFVPRIMKNEIGAAMKAATAAATNAAE